jgi:apolipoprotein N-acyltransferase
VNQLLQARGARFAAAVVSGVLFYFTFGLTPWWLAAWLAPIPLLLAAFQASRREALLLAWLAAAIGLSSNFTYYLKTTGTVATVVVLLLQVLVWGFFAVRTRAAVAASRNWLVVFVYPVLLAAISTLVSFFSPHGTWGSLAYTQMDALPVIQIASVLGAPAVVFLVGLFASTVAVALYRGLRIERPLLAYGVPLVLIAAGLGYGAVRLRQAKTAPTVRIGMVAIDDFIAGNTPPERAEAVWRGYDDTVARLAAEGARIVVLPEKITALAPEEAAKRQQELASLAQRTGVYLVAGLQLNRAQRKDNASWLFSPTGELLAEYHKQHLVPHLESDLAPGKEEIVRTINATPFGLAICRDLIFTDFGRRYGRLGVSAMLVPAWDFYRDAWMASGVAALRGVESGFSVVRAGRESCLNVSDRYGHTIARQRSDYLPGSSLLADLPLGPATPTLYARHGNAFGWLAVAASAIMIVVMERAASQPKAATPKA